MIFSQRHIWRDSDDENTLEVRGYIGVTLPRIKNQEPRIKNQDSRIKR